MENKRILTLDDACAYTGFSRSTMYKLTSAGIIPHSKPTGKSIFFDRIKLEEWMMSAPVLTEKEVYNGHR